MNISFEYSHIFDQHISELVNSELDQDAVSSAKALIPDIELMWKLEGAKLLDTACEISGFSFKQSELKCIVSVSDFVSMSHPFIVNVKNYLDPLKRSFLNEVIFHEALHILLTDNWKVWPTTLIKEYGQGDPAVGAHLHLMSLECATHIHLCNFNRLSEIDRWYEKIGAGYTTAWKVISHQDKYREFLHELKNTTQWQTNQATRSDFNNLIGG